MPLLASTGVTVVVVIAVVLLVAVFGVAIRPERAEKRDEYR
jgi:hypothetical protein